MQKCKFCGEVKTTAEFSLGKGGCVKNVCKVCAAEKQREWYDANKNIVQIKRSARNISQALTKLKQRANEEGYAVKVYFGDTVRVIVEEQE